MDGTIINYDIFGLKYFPGLMAGTYSNVNNTGIWIMKMSLLVSEI